MTSAEATIFHNQYNKDDIKANIFFKKKMFERSIDVFINYKCLNYLFYTPDPNWVSQRETHYNCSRLWAKQFSSFSWFSSVYCESVLPSNETLSVQTMYASDIIFELQEITPQPISSASFEAKEFSSSKLQLAMNSILQWSPSPLFTASYSLMVSGDYASAARKPGSNVNSIHNNNTS